MKTKGCFDEVRIIKEAADRNHHCGRNGSTSEERKSLRKPIKERQRKDVLKGTQRRDGPILWYGCRAKAWSAEKSVVESKAKRSGQVM